MKHNEFTTRTELKSLTRSIKCAETECGRLRMLKVCLGNSSMCLGVPFIAPRQLGAVGGILGRQILPFVGWRTGQPSAPPDSPCSCPVRDLLPFLAHPTVADSWQLAHRTVSGAPCQPLARSRVPRGLRGRPLAQLTVGSPDSPVHHQTVRWILVVRRWTFPESDDFVADNSPDSPVHHRTDRWFIAVRRRRVPRVACSLRLVWRTGHCPVHHRTVWCPQTEQELAANRFSHVSST
jgi:hypothetical protein